MLSERRDFGADRGIGRPTFDSPSSAPVDSRPFGAGDCPTRTRGEQARNALGHQWFPDKEIVRCFFDWCSKSAAGLFADEHDFGILRSLTENSLCCIPPERTGSAIGRFCAQF
jgi:hypothetical protein